jgi:sterol desaturase/sphingolipid hydroxylase (fatty acid hydroxylase superfamily)
LIAGIFEFMLCQVHKAGRLPLLSLEASLTWSDAYIFPLLFVWGDLHFYVQHRCMHESAFLYRNFHKVHHESFNPTPWSGLSFHPVETLAYLSSVLIVFVAPMKLWMLKAMFLALLVSPSFDHTGHGIEGSPLAWRHYIHHSKFNFNYSGNMIITNYITTTTSIQQQQLLTAVSTQPPPTPLRPSATTILFTPPCCHSAAIITNSGTKVWDVMFGTEYIPPSTGIKIA